MDTANDFDPLEWVSLAEAARLAPSPRAGKRTHISTVYRWARKYGWEVRRRGSWRFIRREDVLALFQVEAGQAPPSRQERARQKGLEARRERTERLLREAGML